MVGTIVTVVGLFVLLYACSEITPEKFEQALRKQKNQWDQQKQRKTTAG